MIRTIISDIGNVLSGFIWYDFYKSKGYSEMSGFLLQTFFANPIASQRRPRTEGSGFILAEGDTRGSE